MDKTTPELLRDAQDLLNALIEGEDPSVFEEALQNLVSDTDKKIERLFYAHKFLSSMSDTVTAEAERLKRKKKAFENGKKRVNEFAKALLQAREEIGEPYRSPIVTARLQQSSSVNCLVDPSHLPVEYQKVSIKPDLEKMKKVLLAGGDIEGVELDFNEYVKYY